MSHLPTLEITSDLLSYPPAVASHLVQAVGGLEDAASDVAATYGYVSKDGAVAVVSRGPNIDVINVNNNERLAAWSFGSSSTDPGIEVTCIEPLVTQDGGKDTQIVVGLDCGLEGGLVAVFDIPDSKVVRAVSVPQPVTSLALVAGSGGPVVPTYFHPSLLYFHGIVAVGSGEGRTILLDLCLDETNTDDLSPATLSYLELSANTPVARLRREAIAAGTHLAIDLTQENIYGDKFQWEGLQFELEEVTVSALHFCPALAALTVGYNFGCWKLINLPTLEVDYASPYQKADYSVTNITFQEPENDPRNYVYYWVLRGEKTGQVGCHANATLYSLSYRHRQDMPDSPLYSGLETVVLRFEHELGGDPALGPVEASCPLAAYTIEQARDNADIEQAGDMGLVVLVWRAGRDSMATYLGMFDINAWYNAQMPSAFREEEDELCGYFSFCELEGTGSKSGGVLDMAVSRDTISKYSGAGPILDQHCYPSSLAYDLLILTGRGMLAATHHGLQRRVLAELANQTTTLVQPTQLYEMCVRSGLTSAKDLTTASQQREALLTMALEHNMVGVIVAAARDWADGRFSTAGCTLKFLLDWAWRRVASIKERLDVASVPLFDCSVPEVDDKCRQLLTQLSSQLANLCTVLAAVTSGAGFITQLGMEELECRQNVTGLVLLYTQAIHWFVSVGLLPEQIDSQASPFPAKQLLAQYREKRRQLAALPASYGQPGLLVDILCKDIGDELRSAFERGGGPGSYPPPSLQALLSTFLADCPAPAKLRLVQYFFLDLAHLLPPDTWPDLVDSLIKFPSAFSLPPSVIKLTQAFWLLDHEDWDGAVAMMLDPLIQEDDLTSAHHRAILIVLLTQKQHSLALRYTRLRRPPVTDPSDVELHTAVLLANGAIQEAFTFQRSRRGATTFNSIMLQFFRRAEELGKLDAVLQLSLSTQEEREFVSFLQQTDRADSREVLLMYYLQRSRFTEAMQLNEQLKGVIGGGARSAAREAIMERYNHILPGLAKSFGTRKVCLTGASSFNQRPVPMSVTIKDRHFSLNSHASLIEQQLSNKPASPTPATPFRPKNKRGMIGLLSESVVSPQVKRKFTESTLCFPSETIVDSSGLDTPDMSVTNDLVSPPSKRTRLGDVTSLNMSVTSIRRLSRFMTAEALTILSTPNVTRKSIRRTSSPPRPVPSTTPQSILKVKRLMKDALEESPLAQEGNIGNILNVTDRNVSRLTRSRESTPAKSLRVSFSSGKGVKIAPTASPAVAELSGGAVSTSVIEEEEATEAPSTNDVSKVSSKSSASGGRDDSFHSLDETMESDMEVDSPPPHVNFSWVSKDAPPWVDTPDNVLTAPSKVLSVESPEKVPVVESPEKVPMDESPENVPVVDSPEKVLTAPSKVLTAANTPEFDTLHLRNRVVTETLTPRNEGWQKDQVPPHSTILSTASQGWQKCQVAPDSTPTAAAYQSSSGAEFDTLHLRNRVVTETFSRVNTGWSTEDTLSPASRAEIEQVIKSAEEKIRRKEDEVREKIVSSTAANVDEEEVEAANTDEVDEANKEITSQTKDGSDEGVILLSDTEDADENSDSESEDGSDAEENAGEEEDDEEGDSQGEDEDDEEDQASDEDEAKLDFSWAPEGSFKKAFEGESVEAIQKLVAEEVEEELEMKNSDQNATGDTEDLDYSPDEAYDDKNEQVEESVVISDDDDDENKTGNLPSYIGFDTEIENTSVKHEEAELSEVRDENEDNDEQSDENQELQSEDEFDDENAEVKESENEVENKLDEETQEPASSEEDVWTTEPFKFDSYLDDEVIEVDDDDDEEEEPETIDQEHDDTYRSKEDEMKWQGVNVNEEESNEEKIEKVADSEECQIDISKSASNITTEEQEMSCTDTTDDMDIKVNIEIDETSTDDVGGKTGDVMRELLFKKEATTLDGSIVATRASSIAGSVISDLPGLDSASMDPKFDFADIEPIKGDVGETDIDINTFDFSKPDSMDPTNPEDLKGGVSLNDEDPPIGQADQMRDLLDKVCSSNTRASSVCGTKASSTGGLSVSSGFQPTFSFSDVEVVDRINRDVGEGPEFDFSKPGCNSTETAVETQEKQGMDISENNEDADDDEWEDMDEDEDENKDGDEDESINVESGYEDKDEESEDASEEETDGEEAPGLDFSWTKIGTPLDATAEQTIADIVKEEMEQDMSYDFAKPENTSMESVEDLEKVPSYQFTKPSDPQDDVDMEVENPEDVQNFNGEEVTERLTSEQSSGVLESADTISKEVDQQDVNIKPTQIETALTNIAGITKLKSATSEAKSTPKKAQSTPSKAGVSASIIKSTPSKEHSTSSKTQQTPSKTSSTPSKAKSTPSKIQATPTRRSRRLSSASTDNSPQSPSTRQTPRRATSKTQMEEVSTSSLAMDVIPEIPEEKELTPKRGNKVASEPVFDTLHLRNRVVIETLSPKAEGWNQGSKLDDSKAVESPVDSAVESPTRKGSGRLAKNNESATPLKEETTSKQNVTPRRMPKRGAISEVSPKEENISKKTDTPKKTLEELAGKTSNQTSGSKEAPGPGVVKQVSEDAKINKDSGITPKRTPRRGAKKDIPEENLPISEHIISPKRTPRRGAQKDESDETKQISEHFITPKRTPRRGVVKGGPEETEVQKIQMEPSTPKRTPKRGGAIESTEKVGSTSKLSAIPEKVDISEPQVTPKKAASSSNVSDESKPTLRKAATPRNTPKRGAANLADIPEEPKILEQPFEDEKNTASHVTSKTQTPPSSSNILVSTGRNRRRRHSETTAEATEPSPQVNTEPKTTKGRGRPRRNSEAAVEIQTPEPSPLVKTELPSTKGRGRLRRNSETAMDVSVPEPSPQASTEAQTTTGRGRLRRNSETAMDVSGLEPSPQASTEAQTTTGRGRLRRNSETAATEVSTSVGARTRRRSSITPTTTPLATTESSPITKSSVSARKTKNQSPLKAEAPISGRKAKMLSPRKIVLMKNALKETLQENKSLEPEKEKGVQNSSEEDMEVDNLAGVSSSKLGTPSGRSTRRRDRSSPDITLSPGVDRKEELFPGSPGEAVAEQIDEKNKSVEIGKTEDKSNTSLGKDKVEETVIPQRETRRKSTPLKQSIEGTPTRRSRRVSGEGLSSERVDTAPDGGIIAGRTPRKVTPSKARRHTSVKPADVEKALALEPVLETPEEEEAEDVEMKAETDAQPERKRRGSSIQKPDANLQVIEEESETSKTTPDSSEVKRSTRKTKFEVPEQSSESSPSSSPSNSPAKNDEASTSQASTSPMAGSSRPALRSASETEVVTSRSTRRQSRRHTITTLETDVDLFTPPPAKSSGRMSMGAGTEADKKKKKYVVSKKKTSVRIQ